MLLFCDTDCLIQLFISDQTALLKWFRNVYGLSAIVVQEVEAELYWHAKFRNRFESDLKKAIATGIISVFDYSRPELQLSFLPVAQANTRAREILGTGRIYASIVGLGEAYSHAACVHLGTPLMSHDISAIKALHNRNLQIAAPVLRVFDLIVLAYHKKGMSSKDCKLARQALVRSNEWIPAAFARNSFEDGLRHYNPRLHDRADHGGSPPGCQNYYDPLYLAATVPASAP